MKEVFDLDTHIDVVKHHGGTDPLVLCKVLIEHHGLQKQDVMDKLTQMQEMMTNHYMENQHRAGEGLQLLPGILDLLKALKARPDVEVGLVTGNLEPIGWAKMEALGVKHLFSEPYFGGFGSDFCSGNLEEMWQDRSKLIQFAAQKASGNFKSKFHVGDTPYDVLAARAARVTPVGVVTGVFEEHELSSAVPEAVIVQDFSDLSAAMEVFGLQHSDSQ